jgi:long-chain acyl-CoA synthetase
MGMATTHVHAGMLVAATSPRKLASERDAGEGAAEPSLGLLGLLRLLWTPGAEKDERPMLARVEKGRLRTWSRGDVARRARAFADALVEAGLERGDRLILLSESRPEWAVALFGAWRAGLVVVPLDPGLTPAELQALMKAVRPRAVVASRGCIEAGLAPQRGAPEAALFEIERLPDPAHVRLMHAPRPTAPDDVVLIAMSSGSTGSPKGVLLTAANLLFEVNALEAAIPSREGGEASLSILGSHHLLELTCVLLMTASGGGSACILPSLHPADLGAALREYAPTRMVVVPQFLTLLRASTERSLAARGARARRLFRLAHAISAIVPVASLRRALFRGWHREHGGRLDHFVCGGAPLDPDLAGWFERMGVDVLQGYGLTETSPVVAVETRKMRRPGSVGRPLEGVEVRVLPPEQGASAGEIVTRGPHVMAGVMQDGRVSREGIDGDGWFHTGDLGRIDEDGFLHVVGRSKSLIVLGSGKKVQPEEVELALCREGGFTDACVIGLDGPRGVAPGAVIAVSQLGALAQHEIEREVLRLTRDLAPWKRPLRVLVHEGALPRTASRKLRRDVIHQWALAGQEAST